ncbi:MAG: cupin domain-containing protein [Chloroflexota bacterium]
MASTAKFGNVAELLGKMEADTPPKNILDGNPETIAAELTDSDKLNAGVWGSSVGKWRIDGYSVNEIMIIQSGRVRLTEDDGPVTELGPGDMFYVPKGWKGTREKLEDVQKVYVMVY